ncbi:MAG: response regulator [Polyangiaceae bacterium]|nr:response regulator [Polyangiaceae bacterium]
MDTLPDIESVDSYLTTEVPPQELQARRDRWSKEATFPWSQRLFLGAALFSLALITINSAWANDPVVIALNVAGVSSLFGLTLLNITLGETVSLHCIQCASLIIWGASSSQFILSGLALWLIVCQGNQRQRTWLTFLVFAETLLFFAALLPGGIFQAPREQIDASLDAFFSSSLDASLPLLLVALIVAESYRLQRRVDALNAAVENLETRKKSLEEQYFLQARRAGLRQLLPAISHSLNNLFSVITGTSGVLRSARAQPEAINEAIFDLEIASRQGRSLVQRLLNWSQYGDEQEKSVEVTQLLEERLPVFMQILGEKFEVKLRAPKKKIHLDLAPAIFEQAVLTSIALFSTSNPEGGQFQLLLDSRKKRVKGKNETWVTQLQFSHLHQSGVRPALNVQREESRGIPSSTQPSSEIQELHAALEALMESSAGIFHFDQHDEMAQVLTLEWPQSRPPLPIDSNTEATQSPQEERSQVLIVEDNDLVRRSTERLLRSHGYQVTTAHHALEALAILDRGTVFDALIVDQVMPSMKGDNMISALRARGDKTPILLLSGEYFSPSTLEVPLDTRTSFLAKPVETNQLLSTLKTIIEESRQPSQEELKSAESRKQA